MQLENMLAQPEGKRLEFKRDLSSPKPLLRTLAAFANTAGGTLVIGVDDDRSIPGLADPLLTESRLVNLVNDSISPSLIPDIDIVRWRSTNVIVVNVHLSPSRPHQLSSNGTVYVRLGSSNRRADPQLIAEMQRSARHESFDESPYPSESIDSLAYDVITAEFSTRRHVRRTDLANLGLTTRYQAHDVPTVGGLVLFGNNRKAFPDATIVCARFDGTNRTRIIDTTDTSGPSLPGMVRDAMDFIDGHFARRILVTGLTNEVQRPVPLVAVREALVNAAVHADYSQHGGPIRVALFDDRLEIENPGLLPNGLAVEDLSSGISRIRNRVIARTFKELGYIEQWGSGIARILDEVRSAGLPAPIFEELGGRFRVTFPTTTANQPALSPDEQTLLDVLGRASTAGMSTAELTAALGRSRRTTRTRMTRLVELGLVYEVGSGPNDPTRRYVKRT